MSSQDITNSMMNKTMGQQTGSAKTHLDSVSQLAKTARLGYQVFHNDLEKLLQQVTILRENVKNNPTQIKKFFKTKLKPVQDALVFGEQSQRQQNKAAQQQMTQIKRQNRETADSIVKTFQKLKYMETRIGHYV